MSNDLDIRIERAPREYIPSSSALSRIRAASAALMGGGITSIAYGVHIVSAAQWFAGIVVPVFLGVVGGSLIWIEASLIKRRLAESFDAAEWLRSGVALLITSIIVGRYLAPRLQAGVGYVMAGAALATAAFGLCKTYLIRQSDS